MSECSLVRESMPQLLVEALDSSARETTHQHIETCLVCGTEWLEVRATWDALGAVPELTIPARVRENFLGSVEALPRYTNVLPFRSRPALRWIAQAAAVVILVGGGFYAGRVGLQNGSPSSIDSRTAGVTQFPIAAQVRLPASQLGPQIEGNPDIRNVRFVSSDGEEVSMSFELTSEVTVKGSPDDKNLANLVSYVLRNRENSSQSRARAIEFVKANSANVNEPQVARALAHVLGNEPHEGVRIKAVDALQSMPASGATPETRAALIEALRNDPNPAVRIKAVEALAILGRENTLGAAGLDMLRQKAAQQDENPYVRVKAAEALSQINL